MNVLRPFIFLSIAIFFSLIVILFFSGVVFAPVQVTVSIGSATIPLEIAQTPDELTQGLSGREGIDGGMWFIFPKDDFYGIWMKEMLFPLDIIWLDADLNVVSIEENVLPSSFPTTFWPAEKARYVLEVPAGFSEKYNVATGTRAVFFRK